MMILVSKEAVQQLLNLAKQQWLIPLFPLLAAAIQSLLPRRPRALAAGLTIPAMSASCLVAIRAFVATLQAPGQASFSNFSWFNFGTTSLQMGMILDPLTAGMAVMVTFVGLMI